MIGLLLACFMLLRCPNSQHLLFLDILEDTLFFIHLWNLLTQTQFRFSNKECSVNMVHCKRFQPQLQGGCGVDIWTHIAMFRLQNTKSLKI